MAAEEKEEGSQKAPLCPARARARQLRRPPARPSGQSPPDRGGRLGSHIVVGGGAIPIPTRRRQRRSNHHKDRPTDQLYVQKSTATGRTATTERTRTDIASARRFSSVVEMERAVVNGNGLCCDVIQISL